MLKVELTPARLTAQPGVWTEEVAARLEFAPFFVFQFRCENRGTFPKQAKLNTPVFKRSVKTYKAICLKKKREIFVLKMRKLRQKKRSKLFTGFSFSALHVKTLSS